MYYQDGLGSVVVVPEDTSFASKSPQREQREKCERKERVDGGKRGSDVRECMHHEKR
jgi:hypothetical protein